MMAAGVICDCAIFEAMAQMRYTEPVATLDADVLVAVPSPEKPGLLRPIYEFCASHAYHAEGEAIRVGAWPVQFIPAYSPLTQEALEHAEPADFEGVALRVVRADYLAAIALSVGRAKDFTRIMGLLESGNLRRNQLETLSRRHGLQKAWKQFEARFRNELEKLIERHGEGQKARASLNWAEKVHMAEAVREDVAQFTRARKPIPGRKSTRKTSRNAKGAKK